MADNDSPITRKEFDAVMEKFTKELNKAFGFVYQRFDDIERRIERLESDLHTVKNDTRMIHPMFEWIRTENEEFGELRVRVEKLEEKS